jgi:hypothetical protein
MVTRPPPSLRLAVALWIASGYAGFADRDPAIRRELFELEKKRRQLFDLRLPILQKLAREVESENKCAESTERRGNSGEVTDHFAAQS